MGPSIAEKAYFALFARQNQASRPAAVLALLTSYNDCDWRRDASTWNLGKAIV